jgi:fibro-slime domain-containing protein
MIKTILLSAFLAASVFGFDFEPPTIPLEATIRDFHAGRDFESEEIDGVVKGLVANQLPEDGTPEFVGSPGEGGISSSLSFGWWYHDVETRNVKTNVVMDFVEDSNDPGVFVLNQPDFFPIDGALFGKEGREHNYHFTMEMHTTFTFHGGEFVEITSDDDAWLFINGKLAIDLGGAHGASKGRVELNNLGLAAGQEYRFELFYAERHTSDAVLIVRTSCVLGGRSFGPSSDSDWRAYRVVLFNTVEAECVARTGDIDNLGFGWALDFNPFSGEAAPEHDYPFSPDEDDPSGTDRIQVITSYDYESNRDTDGYTDSTSRPNNRPTPITINFDFRNPIHAAVLQMFVDDFQAPVWGSRFQAKLNGIRAPFLEEILNSLDQSGPVGKLISVELPQDYLGLLAKGRLVISIDDATTGAGDGFAIDFARLLINPNVPQKTGRIEGVVVDENGAPVEGALVVGAKQEIYTDEDGRFALTNVLAGLTHLTIRKEGFEIAEQNVDVNLVAVAETEVRLRELVDSDGDGLTDQQEMEVYHTDPNNPDTDGDEMSDYAEVKGGTDPLVNASALRVTSGIWFPRRRRWR